MRARNNPSNEILETTPLRNKLPPPPPESERIRIPGSARYRSPRGEVHRGRLFAINTDCGRRIGKGWEDVSPETRVTCKQCRR